MNIAKYENANVMGRLKDLNEWIDEDRLYVRTIGDETDTYYTPEEYLVFDAILEEDGKILLGISTGDVGEEFYIDFENSDFEIFVKDVIEE